MLFSSVAYAQTAEMAARQPSMLEMFFPLLAMLVIFYFLMARPQQKRLKEHQSFLTNLKRGDQVVTAAGLCGEVTGITDKFVTLEIADNVRVRFVKSQVTSSINKEGLNP